MSEHRIVVGGSGEPRRSYDLHFVDSLEQVESRTCLACSCQILAGADVDYITAAATIQEESEDCMGQRGTRRVFLVILLEELGPVINGHGFVQAGIGNRSLANERRGAGSHRLNRVFTGLNFLDIDSGS